MDLGSLNDGEVEEVYRDPLIDAHGGESRTPVPRETAGRLADKVSMWKPVLDGRITVWRDVVGVFLRLQGSIFNCRYEGDLHTGGSSVDSIDRC